MRILIAPDKFKGSLSAADVAENIATGVRDVLPRAEIEIAAVADGGDGTAEVICRAQGGEWITCSAHDALGRTINAKYAWMSKTTTAVVEMSEAAGMRQLTRRDPLHANTRGVGEMLAHAAGRRPSRVIVGLGGSATNDGGFGMARALGFRFFAGDQEIIDGPADLVKLTRIVSPADLRLPPIIAAADVQNPLVGQRGATRVFGPQKGATPADLDLLESALTRLADVAAHDLLRDFRSAAGAGAAGGLGFGLMTFCGAQFRAGFEVVAEAIDLETKIRRTDIVITGEGRLDAQTLEGKAPAGVAKLARTAGKPVYAIAGEVVDAPELKELFARMLPLARPPVTRTVAIKLAPQLLRERAAELARELSRA